MLARAIELTEPQAYLHDILDPIMRHTDEGRTMYSTNGNRLVAGDRLVLSDLARTLEQLAERGADDLYTGELAAALSSHLREHGGEITLRDLSEYRVIRRQPVRVAFLGHEFRSNPPPSTGRRPDRARAAAARPARAGRPARERRGDGAAGRDHARAGDRPRRAVHP